MAKSKIKINPVTMEIEIEVSDSFLEKYFEKLTNRLPKSKKPTPKIKSIKTKTKSEPKLKTAKKKTIQTPVVKRKEGSIKEIILEKIKMGKDGGVSTNEIIESTGLQKKQLYNAIKLLKEKGIIKAIGWGQYMCI